VKRTPIPARVNPSATERARFSLVVRSPVAPRARNVSTR
jgi:hypothetical protein